MKQIAKVVVGSQVHRTADKKSDWDYRGIFMADKIDIFSPFKNLKNTSWIEGNEDNTSYELREFCKLATKGNATILEVFFSDMIIETSDIHKEMQDNWYKFMNTRNFIAASRGYASNQYKKALSYDDLGALNQPRTAKFVISFLRVMWQCEMFLKEEKFYCSLENCPYKDFIMSIKRQKKEEMDIPLCFKYMEELNQKLYKAEEYCKKNNPDLYNHQADIPWIEEFLLRSYDKIK